MSERTVRYRLDELLGPEFRSRLPELVAAVAVAESLDLQQSTRGRGTG